MFSLFSRSVWALSGAALATTAAAAWFFFLTAGGGNPYSGILVAAVLPAILLLALLLIPIGLWRARKQPASTHIHWPRVALFATGTTLVNVLILAHSGYRVVHYMDSVSFCGQTCHTPMEPQFVAYGRGPHSRVDCVRCHVEPTAAGYVRSKLNGTHQAIAAMSDTFARPIHAAAGKVPSTAATCEACHSIASTPAESLRVIPRFSDAEHTENKPSILLMNTRKIHDMHASAGMMPMPCTDCHSRPAHPFELPEDAVDRALDSGEISRGLPFIRKEAVQMLRAAATAENAESRLLARYGSSEDSRKSASALRSIHQRNVFPAMKVTWGTYVNRLGHEEGCFRCHDGNQAGQDCATCHTTLATRPGQP